MRTHFLTERPKGTETKARKASSAEERERTSILFPSLLFSTHEELDEIES